MPSMRLSIAKITTILLLQLAIGVRAAPSWIPFDTTQFARHLTIYTPANKPVELYWSLSSDLATINIGVASNNSAGWLAVGFSDTNGMKGADIALGYVKSGTFTLEDRFTPDFIQPVLDVNQNLKLTGSWTTSTYTAFTFSRPTKVGCNNNEDRDLSVTQGTRQHVLVAFGTSMTFGQHAPTDRGSTAIDLNAPTDAAALALMNPPVGDLELIRFNLVSPNTTVPAKPTSYCYSYFELPTDAKYHVIQELPVVQDPRVHHLVMYVCDTPPTQLFNSTSPKVQCDIPNPCIRFFAEWAPGVENRTYPEEYAKAVGQGDLSAKYIMLEVHYNQVDPTGFNDPGAGYTLMLSKKLRKIDLGILTVGMGPDAIFEIPAKQKKNVTYEFPTECSSLMKEKINIMGAFVHMHKRGSAGEVSIVRKDTNRLESLVKVDYFDFNSQGTTLVTPRTLTPGDRVLMNCVWDSTNEVNSTKGGLASYEEMCFGFIEYYPVQAVSAGWRLPFTLNATGGIVNVTDPFGGNVAVCPHGTNDTIIQVAPFNTPLPALTTCSTSGALQTKFLSKSFVLGALVMGFLASFAV